MTHHPHSPDIPRLRHSEPTDGPSRLTSHAAADPAQGHDPDPAVQAPSRPGRRMPAVHAVRADRARNHAALIAAAREVFAEHGLDASMDAVAARAGVGTGTAYRHFANKYELAHAVFDDEVDMIAASVTRTADERADSDPWRDLCDVIELLLTAQSENRAIRDILMAEHQADWTYHDALLRPLHAAFGNAQRAKAVGDGVHITDVMAVLSMLCALTDQVGEFAPRLWHRYLPSMLAGLRSDARQLADTPISEHTLRSAQISGLLRYR